MTAKLAGYMEVMTDINPAATAARENARHSNGRFDTQEHTAPEATLSPLWCANDEAHRAHRERNEFGSWNECTGRPTPDLTEDLNDSVRDFRDPLTTASEREIITEWWASQGIANQFVAARRAARS